MKKKRVANKERELKAQNEIEDAYAVLHKHGIQSRGLWCITDIMDAAKEMRHKCSAKAARAILENAERNFDAEYGITWEHIRTYIGDYFGK